MGGKGEDLVRKIIFKALTNSELRVMPISTAPAPAKTIINISKLFKNIKNNH